MFFYKDPWKIGDDTMNAWPYWLFEEIIKTINKPDPDKVITISPS